MVSKYIDVNITDNIREKLEGLSLSDRQKAKKFIQEFSEYLQVYWFRSKYVFSCDLREFPAIVRLNFNETHDPAVLFNQEQNNLFIAAHNELLPSELITQTHRDRNDIYIIKRMEGTRLLFNAIIDLDFTADHAQILGQFKREIDSLTINHYIFEPPALYDAGLSWSVLSIMGTKLARGLGQDEKVFEKTVGLFCREQESAPGQRDYYNRLIKPIVTETFAKNLRDIAKSESDKKSLSSGVLASSQESVTSSSVSSPVVGAAADSADGRRLVNDSPVRLSEARNLALSEQDILSSRNIVSRFFGSVLSSTTNGFEVTKKAFKGRIQSAWSITPKPKIYIPGMRNAIIGGAAALTLTGLGVFAYKRYSPSKLSGEGGLLSSIVSSNEGRLAQAINPVITSAKVGVPAVKKVVTTGARHIGKVAKRSAGEASAELVVQSGKKAAAGISQK